MTAFASLQQDGIRRKAFACAPAGRLRRSAVADGSPFTLSCASPPAV